MDGKQRPADTKKRQDTEETLTDRRAGELQGSNPRTRKDLLLQILGALTELSQIGLEETEHTVAFDAGRNVLPSDGEQNTDVLRKLRGTDDFHAFRKRIYELDKELQRLAQTFRQFGSAGIISSCAQLRTRLAKVLFHINLNASNLFFPYVSVEYPPETIPNWRLNSDSKELELLGDDLVTFITYLQEFPALIHESSRIKVLHFRQLLKQWAMSLDEFKCSSRNPIRERYLHDLCGEMDCHFESITTSISGLTEYVVPSIQVAQQRTVTILVSLSGLATFVSAVTASCIQIAYNNTDSPLQTSVNAFWFSSLVFSVASAVNSLLGLAWTQSHYRSPSNRVPWWISIWIQQSPFVFLIAALVAFSIGLVLFTWASQHLITCLLTTIFTGISLFSLSVISVWLILERSIFLQYKGQRLLADVIADNHAVWIQYMCQHFVFPTGFWSKNLAWHPNLVDDNSMTPGEFSIRNTDYIHARTPHSEDSGEHDFNVSQFLPHPPALVARDNYFDYSQELHLPPHILRPLGLPREPCTAKQIRTLEPLSYL